MKAVVPLHHGTLDIANEFLRFRHGGIVPRYHDDRHPEMPGDRRIDSRFGYGAAIESHIGQPGTRNRVSTHAGRIVGAGVISQKDDRIKRLVDALHHHEGPRPRPHHRDVIREHLDEKVLTVPMRVADEHFGRARRLSGVDGRQHFPRHELAKPAVLKTRGSQLLPRHHSHHPFHVSRDVDLEAVALRLGGPAENQRRPQEGDGSNQALQLHRLSLRVEPATSPLPSPLFLHPTSYFLITPYLFRIAAVESRGRASAMPL